VAWATLLDQRHLYDDVWKQAKLDAVRARLPPGTRLTFAAVPMTTDWLVALEVERRGDRVAVDDTGPEWRALRDARLALNYVEAVEWLEQRADQAPP
jgi:hypothetical protein